MSSNRLALDAQLLLSVHLNEILAILSFHVQLACFLIVLSSFICIVQLLSFTIGELLLSADCLLILMEEHDFFF